MSRPCCIEWSDGRITFEPDYESAREHILAYHRHAVIESDNGDVDEILCWRDARTAGLDDSAIAVIRFKS
jgi:hypothetical protein